MKTIKQLADEFGVSKTAIRKKMDEDFRKRYTETGENGVILVSEEGEKLLESLRKQVETERKPLPETPETVENAWLRDQLDKALKRNEELQQQLLELSSKAGNALDAISNTQLADKLIEAKKLQVETPEPVEDIRNQSLIKRIKWAFFG